MCRNKNSGSEGLTCVDLLNHLHCNAGHTPYPGIGFRLSRRETKGDPEIFSASLLWANLVNLCLVIFYVLPHQSYFFLSYVFTFKYSCQLKFRVVHDEESSPIPRCVN